MKATKFKSTELGPIPVDWEVKKLGEIAEVNPPCYSCRPSKFVYVDLESVKGGSLVSENVINSANAPSRAQRQFSKYDVLYQTVRPYQRNNLFVEFDAANYIASTGYAVIRAKCSDARYVYAWVNSPEFVSCVLDNCTGTSYPAINPKKLAEISVAVPPLAEQRRIAGALSDVDELVSALGKLIEKKRNIKTGTMQQLLAGKTRLPGFKGKWMKKRLGECGKLIRDSINTQAFPNKVFFEYSMPSYDDGKIPRAVLGRNIYSNKTPIHGEVLLFNKLNVRKRRIWYVLESRPDAICSSEFLPLYSNTTDLYFLSYAVSLDECTSAFEDCSSGTSNSQKRITPDDFENYELVIPPTLAEQKAIAAVLSDMDAEIAALEADRTKYERIKSGMMHELLTGKVRLE